MSLSGTAFYVALSGAQLTGGIPFLPGELNQVIGRLLIGAGALVTGAMAVYAFRDAYRLWRQ